MAWRDTIKGPASFRGVPFFVETSELAGGRRTAHHEYPFRDAPFVEDLGRRGRGFPIEGYVLGEDYLAARDALLAALEQAGPGELVHPYYKTRRVICMNFRVRESSADGGVARFALEFVETEVSPAFPSSTPAAAVRVDATGDAIVAALRARAAARGAVSLPASALASLSATIADASKSLEAALAPVVTATQDLASLKLQLDNLVLDAAALARQPVDALDGFAGVLGSLGTSPAGPVIAALLNAYAFTPPARPPATTATRVLEREAYDLLLAIVRSSLLVQAARLAPGAEYDSYDAAVAVRDAIASKLDEQAEGADDATYAALAQLRADLVRAVPGEDRDLPRIVRHTPAYTVPSLVLAHRLYGNLSREADLVTRNRIAHPGFVLGGAELEVLANA